MTPRILSLCVVAGLIAGCSTTPDYGCKAPDGTTCKSISEVYRETEGDARRASPYAEDRNSEASTYRPALIGEKTLVLPKIKPGDPVRVEPRILRVWLAPWEDRDEVFYDQSYIYVIVDHGRWQVSQNRGMIESGWRARTLTPPTKRPAAPPEPEAAKSAPTSAPEPVAANRAAARAMEDAGRNMGAAR